MGRTRVTIRPVVVAVGAVLLVALAGCGGSGGGRATGSFSWLRPGAPPVGWTVARIDGGAALAYPPGWTVVRSDPGTEEGDRRVRLLTATTHGHFRSGRGACVIDVYSTTQTSYREIACLVSGPRASAVVVAAAPTATWAQRAPTLERAVSTFIT